jgi:hypothetical protein
VGTPFLKVKIRVLQHLLALLAVLVQQVVWVLVVLAGKYGPSSCTEGSTSAILVK